MKDLALNAQRAKNRVFQVLAPVQMSLEPTNPLTSMPLTHYK